MPVSFTEPITDVSLTRSQPSVSKEHFADLLTTVNRKMLHFADEGFPQACYSARHSLS